MPSLFCVYIRGKQDGCDNGQHASRSNITEVIGYIQLTAGLTTYVQVRSFSKNFLANCFRNVSKKDLKKTRIRSIEEIANVAKIAKVRRMFLAM